MDFLIDFTLYSWNDLFFKIVSYGFLTIFFIYFFHLIIVNINKVKIIENFYGDLNLFYNFSRMISSLLVSVLILCFWFYSLYHNGIESLTFTSFKLSLNNAYLFLSPFFISILFCVLVFNKSKSAIISKF